MPGQKKRTGSTGRVKRSNASGRQTGRTGRRGLPPCLLLLSINMAAPGRARDSVCRTGDVCARHGSGGQGGARGLPAGQPWGWGTRGCWVSSRWCARKVGATCSIARCCGRLWLWTRWQAAAWREPAAAGLGQAIERRGQSTTNMAGGGSLSAADSAAGERESTACRDGPW